MRKGTLIPFIFLFTFQLHAQDKKSAMVILLTDTCDSMVNGNEGKEDKDNLKHYRNMCFLHGVEDIKTAYLHDTDIRTKVLLDACTFYLNETANFFYSPNKEAARKCISFVAKKSGNLEIEKNKELCWDNKVDYTACLMNGPVNQQDIDESLIGILKEAIHDKKDCPSCPQDQ